MVALVSRKTKLNLSAAENREEILLFWPGFFSRMTPQIDLPVVDDASSVEDGNLTVAEIHKPITKLFQE